MTLFKQIIIILSILLTIIFGSVMWFNFNSSKKYVQQQAYTDALHTANSLGLAISTVANPNDISTVETMINSVFDSGYYEKIVLVDMDKKILVKKSQKIVVAGVPDWFINSIHLESPVAHSQIMLGWTPYGTLSVQLNSGHAYMQLWTIFKDILSVFIIISIIGFFILHIALKIILKPLERVREQAEAILDNDFIFQDKIPLTTELKNVVFAMNSMVKKVKEIFEKEVDAVNKYHELMYKDKDIDIYNRRYFNMKFLEYLNSEEKNAQGALVLISLNNFSSIREKIGYEKSKNLLSKISASINQSIYANQEYIAAKIGDKDFAILAPTTSEESLVTLCQLINDLIKKILISFDLDIKDYFINIGYTRYYPNSNIKELYSQADFALTNSKAKGAFKTEVFVSKGAESHIFLGKEAWAKELQNAMDKKRFKLAYQNAVNIEDDTDILHSELFLRLQEDGGILQNAGHFMPMVKELKLGSKIDMHVIKTVTGLSAEKFSTCRGICINLGKEILLKNDNYTWLENTISGFRKTDRFTLFFETQISAVSSSVLIKFSKYLRRLGYGLGLDSFTINSENLILMQKINPSYIKIHSASLLDIANEEDFNTACKSLGVITDSMDIKVIAYNVESLEQKMRLKKLNIKYIQGSLIEEPKILG